MSRLIFEQAYVVIIPTYKSAEKHEHSMLHLFLGSDITADVNGTVCSGNAIFVSGNVMHNCPKGETDAVILIDPTSALAESIERQFLKGEECFGLDIKVYESLLLHKGRISEQNDSEIISGIKEILSLLDLDTSKKRQTDPRIVQLLKSIRAYEYVDKKVSDVAKQLNYSESYLTHLFKKEAGISLKSYLMMSQLEYTWKQVQKGISITQAALDAGYSSPSHFAMICKKTTGLSLTDTDMIKADF